MNITDEPMPGVAAMGATFFALLRRRNTEITLHPEWPIFRREHALANARVLAATGEWDDVVVVEATTVYRVWDRDKLKAVA
jgi:hypothetical protein